MYIDKARDFGDCVFTILLTQNAWSCWVGLTFVCVHRNPFVPNERVSVVLDCTCLWWLFCILTAGVVTRRFRASGVGNFWGPTGSGPRSYEVQDKIVFYFAIFFFLLITFQASYIRSICPPSAPALEAV